MGSRGGQAREVPGPHSREVRRDRVSLTTAEMRREARRRGRPPQIHVPH